MDETTQKKAKEYISWGQYFDYFKSCISENYISKNQNNDQDQLAIQAEHLALLQDVFDFQPRSMGQYVATADFVLGCKKDP